MRLRVVSAGAAQGVSTALSERLGMTIEGTFGAVGAMMERFRAGEACDVVILTRAQIATLAEEGHVIAASVTDIGSVPTSIAVPASGPVPDVSSAASLRAALLAAEAVFFPDPQKSTAGIHFAKVIDTIRIGAEIARRLRTFPNGATAMREMVATGGNVIGCTQATEILATPGARLVAPLPGDLGLETTYTAAVHAQGADIASAKRFVAAILDESSRALRVTAGFRVA